MKRLLLIVFLILPSIAFAQGFGNLYNDKAKNVKTTTGAFGNFLPVSASTVQSALDYINAHASSGAPAGSNTDIQFNSSGVFGGNSGFVYKNNNVGIGSTDPEGVLSIKSNGPLLFIHDTGNEDSVRITNGGGEVDIGISDDNVPSTLSTINMNVGGEMEFSIAGAGVSGHYTFYLENVPKVTVANDGSLNASSNLTTKGTDILTGTGSVSSSGTTLLGSGTVFTTQLHVGDYLTAPGEGSTATVLAITDNSTLTTDVELISFGEAFTYQHPAFEVNSSTGVSRFYVNPAGRTMFTGPDAISNVTIKGGGGGTAYWGDNGQLITQDLSGNNLATFGSATWITKQYGIFTLSGDTTDSGAGFTRVFEMDGIDRALGGLGVEKRCFVWQVAQNDSHIGKYYFTMNIGNIGAGQPGIYYFGSTWTGNIQIGNTATGDTGLDLPAAAATDRLQVNGNSYLGGNGNVTGNLGIGSSNPGQKVDVQGTVRGLGFTQTGTFADTFTGTATFSNAQNSALFTGNVGVGSSNPGQTLDVFGTIRITNGGHFISKGTAPTVATNDCGTTVQGTVTSGSTDLKGSFTVGTLAVTSCSITFTKIYNVAPVCFTQDDTNILATKTNTTTTKLTTVGSVSLSGDVVSYICVE